MWCKQVNDDISKVHSFYFAFLGVLVELIMKISISFSCDVVLNGGIDMDFAFVVICGALRDGDKTLG